jgi:hypothetical protein
MRNPSIDLTGLVSSLASQMVAWPREGLSFCLDFGRVFGVPMSLCL